MLVNVGVGRAVSPTGKYFLVQLIKTRRPRGATPKRQHKQKSKPKSR